MNKTIKVLQDVINKEIDGLIERINNYIVERNKEYGKPFGTEKVPFKDDLGRRKIIFKILNTGNGEIARFIITINLNNPEIKVEANCNYSVTSNKNREKICNIFNSVEDMIKEFREN